VTRRRWPRWRWELGGNLVYLTIDLSNLNLPRVMIYGDDNNHVVHVALSWGNGNSDPVWSIGFPVLVPALIGRKVSY
jgi:hypothetical protein